MSDLSALPQRLSRETIYESEHITLYRDTVLLPSGAILPAYHQLHYPGPSTSCVIFNQRDEILMIQNRRYTTQRLEWEVPAGRMEEGETPEEAARRECMEETGCTLKELRYLCQHNPSKGMSDLVMHVFAARVDTEGQILDQDEVKNKRWMPRNEVLALLRDNGTHCGVSMLALLYALQFGEI